MKLFFSFFTLFLTQSMAINKVGNGGNVVVCQKLPPVILDFYEGEVKEQIKLQKSNQQIASEIIDKLKIVAPDLYQQYQKRLSIILSDFEFKSDISLIDVKDSQHLFKPKSKNCDVIQTIIRKNQITKTDKRFVVDQEIWNKLSPFQQAGLIMHEIIYEHFSKLAEQDSIKARRLNSYLFKNNFNKKQFWDFIRELDIAIYP